MLPNQLAVTDTRASACGQTIQLLVFSYQVHALCTKKTFSVKKQFWSLWEGGGGRAGGCRVLSYYNKQLYEHLCEIAIW